jgi:hypothetical protein
MGLPSGSASQLRFATTYSSARIREAVSLRHEKGKAVKKDKK